MLSVNDYFSGCGGLSQGFKEAGFKIQVAVDNEESYLRTFAHNFKSSETKNLDSNAMKKLKNKNCDWIVANDVSKENIGFNSDYNEVTIHYNDLKKNKETLSHKKKSEISEEIVDRIVTHMN